MARHMSGVRTGLRSFSTTLDMTLRAMPGDWQVLSSMLPDSMHECWSVICLNAATTCSILLGTAVAWLLLFCTEAWLHVATLAA